MPADIPTPFLLALVSVSSCLLNVVFFPQVFPGMPLTKLFVIFYSIILGLWLFWIISIYPVWFSPCRHLPRPKKAWPLLGNADVVFKRPAGNAFLKMMVDVPNDGIICFSGFFNADWLLLTDPKSFADVLVHKSYDYEKPTQLRKFLRIVLGDGLILVEGEEHKFQRKHVSPAFSFRHVKELLPIFYSKAIELSNGVAAEINQNSETSTEKSLLQPQSVVEVNHWANKVTMDIIGVAGLGRDFKTLTNSDDELIKNYEEILEPSTEKALFFTTNLFLPRRIVSLLPWKLNQRLMTTTGNLRTICRQLIRDKRELIKTRNEQNVDILSLLIKSNDFADDMIVDQLLTFLAAGHETTSSAFTWGSYLLAKHPEVQSRLRQEIRSNLPSPSVPQPADFDLGAVLESLPYLNAVCSEVTRLFPPVPVTLRVATRDTVIQSTHVPKGTRVYISPWATNRSPALWGPDAEEFFPERWIDAETGRANNTGGVASNYSIMTFLHGPRSCIGERFAKLELKALLAVWCGKFQMEMADPNYVPIPAGAITSKPNKGMPLRLQEIEGW